MSKTNPAPVTTKNAATTKPAVPKNDLPKQVASQPVITPVAKKTTTTNKPVVAKKPAPKPAAVTTPAASSPTKAEVKNQAKAAKSNKEKPIKLKMERDSFTMPKIEYAQFGVLKARLEKLGQPAKKSELLRAGIMLLSVMTDTALKATMNKVPTIKTGRPKKK